MLKRVLTTTLVALATILSGSCGSLTESRSPSYLIIDSIEAASGAKIEEFFSFLFSDVLTLVKKTIAGQEVFVPTIFNDAGRVTMRVALKDQNVSSPTNYNAVTIERYRVVYVRSDGRNQEGVDVPYSFDGAVSATITAEATRFGFQLVRHQAKLEPPLRALVGLGGALHISTTAEITFYGRDQVGNQVSVTGKISVNFSDFGDPE